jgi:hypothetical protein
MKREIRKKRLRERRVKTKKNLIYKNKADRLGSSQWESGEPVS